jgi:hypothetical protein
MDYYHPSTNNTFLNLIYNKRRARGGRRGKSGIVSGIKEEMNTAMTSVTITPGIKGKE